MTESRQSLADIVDDYDGMLRELRELVSAHPASVPWSSEGESERTFGTEEGTVRVVSPLWVSEFALADDTGLRDEVVRECADVLAAHGFPPFSVVVEDSGHFSYVSGDALGGEVHLSGMAATTMRYTTGSFDEE